MIHRCHLKKSLLSETLFKLMFVFFVSDLDARLKLSKGRMNDCLRTHI